MKKTKWSKIAWNGEKIGHVIKKSKLFEMLEMARKLAETILKNCSKLHGMVRKLVILYIQIRISGHIRHSNQDIWSY